MTAKQDLKNLELRLENHKQAIEDLVARIEKLVGRINGHLGIDIEGK